ncbi:uncharacterized protein J4E87_010423 [Alternaria ethzedia]|uniref:uncharacterized protein n=1 Tax=Alternaria ethzedia TaxID=181014 RepID=UPI0020C4DC7A|nr:uncharacterized protein J4E87_010423 [Alternaria ethzedia]KAI4611821.1 hypothetical protein J4E87_010423 [Alternaria ethzedia]
MSDRASQAKDRQNYARKIVDLVIECRNKVPSDCPEPTLILSDEALRAYVRGLEKSTWENRTDITDYHQVCSDLIERLEIIRDDLPGEWREFSELLRDATKYPEGITPNTTPARPLPPQTNLALEAITVEPVQKDNNIPEVVVSPPDGASMTQLPGIAMSFPTVSAAANPFVGPDGASIFSKFDTETKPADKPFPSIEAKGPERKLAPLEKGLRSRKPNDGLAPGGLAANPIPDTASAKMMSPAPAPKLIFDFGASATSFTAPSTLEPSLSAEPKGKRLRHTSTPSPSSPSFISKDGSPPKIVSSLAVSLDSVPSKSTSTQTDLAPSPNKGQLEMILTILEEERTARIKADTKVEELMGAMSRLQAKVDRLVEEAEASRAETLASIKSNAKAQESVKPTMHASGSKSRIKGDPEGGKSVAPKRKSTNEIVRDLRKEFPPETFHVVFKQLKHGSLRLSGLRKAQPDILQAQIEKVLCAFKVPAPQRKKHASMVIDLANFGNGLTRNDKRYLPVDTKVRDAAIRFADEKLANHLFNDKKWLCFRCVSEQHRCMQGYMGGRVVL